MHDTSWWQATTGVTSGGLGLRTARSTANAAFVASRISSRPLVHTMVEHFCLATGASIDPIMLAYDSRTEDAVVAVMDHLASESALELLDKLHDSAAEADLRWRDVQAGGEDMPGQHSFVLQTLEPHNTQRW